MILATEPSLSDVYSVVEEVWTTFLGPDEPIYPAGAEQVPAELGGYDAAITVTGAWQAVVLVSLPVPLAEAITRAMLGMDDEEALAGDDLTDALGELVNVIGGNVKSLMAGPSKLSLPLVARGPMSSSSSLVEACRLDLGWRGHVLTVIVSVPANPTSEDPS